MSSKRYEEMIAWLKHVDWQSWFSGPKLQIVQVVVALMVLVIYGKQLTWPIIVLAVIIVFFSQIRLLLENLTSLISRSAQIEIEIAGQKM
jgi:ABC-type multidrug transport system fused ATPase/permease subunit